MKLPLLMPSVKIVIVVIIKKFYSGCVLGDGSMKDFKITKCSVSDPEFKAFHERFQTLIIFFIDAANFIEMDDNKWEVYYV